MGLLAGKKVSAKRFAGKELVIVFVNSKEQRRLNKSFRGKDYATDVLSFDPMEPGALGELVICPEVIARQAKEHGLLVREELGYMVLHGFLHLLGFDHEKGEREAKRMFTLQDDLFERMLT
jgi:probable rRNA maturation factor